MDNLEISDSMQEIEEMLSSHELSDIEGGN